MQVADIIRKSIRSDDIAARLGGDEFVILLYLEDIAVARNIALRILRGVEEIVFEADSTFTGLSTSIGIAYHPDNNVLFSQLMRVADVACYQSKERGKNQITLLRTHEDHSEAVTG